MCLVVMSVCEQGVPQPGADGEHAPFVDILHEGNFAEALNDRIVVHDDRRVEVADPGYGFKQSCGEIEAAALPVARKVLRPTFDRAVRIDDSGASDADERSEVQTLL